MHLVRQRPQRLLIRTVFCRGRPPFVFQISGTTRFRLALAAHPAHVTKHVAMASCQLFLGQTGVRETFAQGLKCTRRREGQRIELSLRQIELASNGFHFVRIQPLQFVPADSCASEAAQKAPED